MLSTRLVKISRPIGYGFGLIVKAILGQAENTVKYPLMEEKAWASSLIKYLVVLSNPNDSRRRSQHGHHNNFLKTALSYSGRFTNCIILLRIDINNFSLNPNYTYLISTELKSKGRIYKILRSVKFKGKV